MRPNRHREKRPQASVHVFPIERRIGLVARTVAELTTRDFKTGRAFWDEHIRQLREELRAGGVKGIAVSDALTCYAKAVQRAVEASPAYRFGG